MSIRVLEIEMTNGLTDRPGLHGYQAAMVLLRSHGYPVGRVTVPVRDGVLQAADISSAVERDWEIRERMSRTAMREWLMPGSQHTQAPLPSCSVMICTRNRTDDLRRCLNSLVQIMSTNGEIIVVDNCPSDDSTARLAAEYPVRYVEEPRKGLNRARTRGAREARGEIVIYTDDDVIVDAGWLDAMREPFAEPGVDAVTGLVMPFEIETDAQELFEQYGGFCRGFDRREFSTQTIAPLAAGSAGAGASMAIRRSLILQHGLFDVELDAGTATQSGGDTYAFFRLLNLGYRIIYTPEAVSWHRHRRTIEELRSMLYGYSVGTYAYFLRCLLHDGELDAIYGAYYWFRQHHLRQLWKGITRRHTFPLSLTIAEVQGCFAALPAYFASRRAERDYAASSNVSTAATKVMK